MNKRGFTLTELLAVIAIMAILSVAAVSGYTTMIKNSRQKSYDTKILDIENAAYKYAKENNIDKITTISVNKLVVLGYLQPDETSDNGLSVLKNPITDENMICNTIDIKVLNNEVQVKYNKNKKDCSLSNREEDERKIGVVGYCDSSPGTTLNPNGDTFDWVKCDNFYVRTNPADGLNNSDIESIAFDYDGNSFEYEDGTITTNNPIDITGYKNLAIVDSVDGQVMVVNVGITYKLTNGKVYFRHVIVRIDRQKPTISFVARNDTIKSNDSVRNIEVYVDDASGSGSEGFYLTRGSSIVGAELNETDYKLIVQSQLGDMYLTPVDKVGNIGDSEKITINNLPGELGCDMSVLDESKNIVTRTNGWYNFPLYIRQHADKFNNGVNYGIVKGTIPTKRSELSLFIDKDTKLVYDMHLDNDVTLSNWYGGLWNVQKKAVKYCTTEAGIDTTPPVVTFKENGDSTFRKSHDVIVTIEDVSTPAKNNSISGFYKSGVNYYLYYAWVPTSVTSEDKIGTKWTKVKMVPSTAASDRLTDDTTKKLTYTVSAHQKDYNGEDMTGDYRLWVKTSIVEDLAQNSNIGNTSGIFKHDNTPPTCVSSGGITNWVNHDITLTGTCSDNVGTTNQSGCSEENKTGYTYNSSGNVSRVQSNEIDSDNQSPGTVYDKAGNSTVCPGDQHTHIDKTAPKCEVSKNPAVTWTNQDTVVNGKCVEQGTIKSDCVSDTSYTEVVQNGQVSKTTPSPGTVKDRAGNETICGTIAVNIDKNPPACNLSKDPNVTWTNQNTTVTGTCDDRSGESGCVKNVSVVVSTSNNTIKQEDKSPGKVEDKAGNVTTCETMNVRIDKKPPACNVSKNPDVAWTNQDTTVTGTCDDRTGESGCVGNVSIVKSTGANTISNSKESPGKVKDVAGNETTCGTISVKIDKKPPACTSSGGSNSWKNTDITITGTCKDGSGQSGCAGHITKTFTDNHNAEESPGKVKDKAGNETTCPANQNVKIDKDPPTCNYTENNSWTNSSVTISWSCLDSLSGCVTSGGQKTYNGTYEAVKTYNLTYNIKDNAGNERNCSKAMNVYRDKIPPSCSVSRIDGTGYWSCSDSDSGINGWTSGSGALTSGSYFSNTCNDNAGNQSSCSKRYCYGASYVCGGYYAHTNDGCRQVCVKKYCSSNHVEISCNTNASCGGTWSYTYTTQCTPCSHYYYYSCWYDC